MSRMLECMLTRLYSALESSTPIQKAPQTLQIPKSRGGSSSTSNNPILAIDAAGDRLASDARQSEEPAAYDTLTR